MTARHPWHPRAKDQDGRDQPGQDQPGQDQDGRDQDGRDQDGDRRAAAEAAHSGAPHERAGDEHLGGEHPVDEDSGEVTQGRASGHAGQNEHGGHSGRGGHAAHGGHGDGAGHREHARHSERGEPARDQPQDHSAQHAQHAQHQEAPADTAGSGTQRRSGRRASLRAQLLIGLIGVLLGVGIVVQVQHTQQDQYSALRQDDLVRLLDEVTQRNEELTDQRSQLRRDLAALTSGSGDRRLAEDYATLQAILAGTVPVEGPGVVVTVEDEQSAVDAQRMVHMLEEIRNAGAEGISVNGERLTTTSAFVDTSAGLTVNGEEISPPYEWRVIGDPQTLAVALDIPGGALASMRNVGAQVSMEQRDLVQITAVREADKPQYAEPTDLETAG